MGTKIALTIFLCYLSIISLLGSVVAFINGFIGLGLLCFVPILILIITWIPEKTYFFIFIVIYLVAACVLCIFDFNNHASDSDFDSSLAIDTTPNINVNEYLPFTEDSKIFKYDSKTLKLKDNLPIIDGATAAFPVYSAFVNAVYPETTKLWDGVFEYNNTVGGYTELAEKNTDIFIGAMPSAEQIKYAEQCGTTFDYTQIGWEAFVFFVHKDNPINSISSEDIRKIYSGEITNWKELGGNDEAIMPYQRNEGSGSQSMMLRFMGDVPIVEPDMETLVGFMGDIVEQVADYRNQTSSIGFSFRYYIEEIVQHPDIKMIAVDGVAPTVENIKNESYPIITPVYAVTYEGNPNPNVSKLIEWMCSSEGQYIIEGTGYVGIR